MADLVQVSCIKLSWKSLAYLVPTKNSRTILSYNNFQQSTIGEIKDVTLVLCAHLEIRTTRNIQVIDMPVSNYSIIFGRY
jgi:hypothetical protein